MTHLIRHYTGIGSRITPVEAQNTIHRFAHRLAQIGYVLRSGAAPGADTAFEIGAKSGQGQAEIYVPWASFQAQTAVLPEYRIVLQSNDMKAARAIAAKHHPNWAALSEPVRLLMTRNVYQVLGRSLESPSIFVLAWTPDGCTSKANRTQRTGGTGLAIAVADSYGVPVINMKNPGWQTQLAELVHANKP